MRHQVHREGQQLPNPVYTLEMPDWVNVVALTPARELVLVTQHRFGTQAQSLEIPGGVIDHDESPLVAAQRELREETGYTSSEWTQLGWSEPNPAMQSNKLFTFVAQNARFTEQIALDPMEDCRVVLQDWEALQSSLHRGEIRHSLVLLALYEFMLSERGLRVGAI
jgi:8-oxo-dGTP pyrophosphatase MutT (NUDIX family)